MVKASLNATAVFLLFLVLCPTTPVLAQGPGGPALQQRVTGTCAPGSYIRVINADGSVVCQVDANSGGTVAAVTASDPLVSSGGTTPNISLPNVITRDNRSNTAIGFSALQSMTTAIGNTAIGSRALQSNTDGEGNTASGQFALADNTTGRNNTASGRSALLSNTTGSLNTASGGGALLSDTTGSLNTASGGNALLDNTTGSDNTAIGTDALFNNTTGSFNTAIGRSALVSTGDLTNATVIGAGAVVDASNKIRLGNGSVTVIEGQVDFTFTSDMTKKENFQPVDGEEVLRKLRGLTLTSWNYIGHDPQQFRHYGPMGQEFFAAFGHDAIGTIGSPTTLTASDLAGILMSAVQALERRSAEQRAAIETLRAENAALQGRLQALETTVQAKEALAQR